VTDLWTISADNEGRAERDRAGAKINSGEVQGHRFIPFDLDSIQGKQRRRAIKSPSAPPNGW